jgi:hypothetical protein
MCGSFTLDLDLKHTSKSGFKSGFNLDPDPKQTVLSASLHGKPEEKSIFRTYEVLLKLQGNKQ